MIRLYQFALSGNCHKVRLLLSLLALPYETIDVAGAKQEHKSPAFLQMSPFGQVPVLTDGDVVVRDSQAILVYLARRYGGASWLPDDAGGLAEVTAWLSTAANEVARGPNSLRLHYKFGRAIDLVAAEAVSTQLFHVLERRLASAPWLAGDHVTIADVAVHPYIALAPEAKLDFSSYPAVRAWLARMSELPGYVGMPGMVT